MLEHSEVVVLWSANPLNTLKIAWNASDEQGIPWFDRLRQSGAIHSIESPKKSTVSDRIGSMQISRLPLWRSRSNHGIPCSSEAFQAIFSVFSGLALHSTRDPVV